MLTRVGEIRRDLEQEPFRLDYRWLAVREVFEELRARGFVGERLEWGRPDIDRLAVALDSDVWRDASAGGLTGEHALEKLHQESRWLNSGDRSTIAMEIDPPHSTLTRALDVLRLLRSMMGPEDLLRLDGPDA